jgi:hypothetical protein
MTDHDALEIELAAMKPREPSAKLRERIACRLAETGDHRAQDHPTVWRGIALVGGLLAASLAAIAAWHAGKEQTSPGPAATPARHVTMAFDRSSPSLWSYRMAMRQSSEAVDRLLDEYANRTLANKSGGAPDFALVRLNFNNDSFAGEL